MNKALLAAGAVIAVILGGVVIILLQGREIDGLERRNTALESDLALVLDANRATALATEQAKAERFLSGFAVKDNADKTDALRREIRTLQRKLTEAARHETALDRPVSAALADALCMQYRAASGHAARDNHPDAAAGPHAGTGDSAATRCGGWRSLTYLGLVGWTGDLLGHAGLEREDKASLRAWAAQTTQEDATMGRGSQ